MKAILLFATIILTSQSFAQGLNKQPFTSQNVQFITQMGLPSTHLLQRSGVEQLDSVKIKTFDPSVNFWSENQTIRYTYHRNGTLQSHTLELDHASLEVIEFQTDGKISRYLIHGWNGNHFEESIQTLYFYDANGFSSHDSTYNWTGTQWEPSGYTTYQVDVDGNILEKVSFHYSGGVYVSSSKMEFMYNSQQELVELKSYVYQFFQWENYYHYLITYDLNGRETSFQYQHWNLGAWENTYQSVSTYAVNNIQYLSVSSWINMAWEHNYTVNYQNDFVTQTSSMYLPEEYARNNHKVVGKQSIMKDMGHWRDNDSTLFFFSDNTASGIKQSHKGNRYQLIQNPVSEQIRIRNLHRLATSVKVFDLTGKEVLVHFSQNEVIHLPIGMLPKGVYVVQLLNNHEKTTVKVIKK